MATATGPADPFAYLGPGGYQTALTDPSQTGPLLDANGNPIPQNPNTSPTPSLPAGAQTSTAPDTTTTPTTDPTAPTGPTKGDTGGVTKVYGGSPTSTGQPSVAQPGATNAPPNQTQSLNDIISQMIQEDQQRQNQIDQQRNGLMGTITDTINKASQPVQASDPEIAGPTNAFNAQGQRARQLLQEQLTQGAVAGGRTTGSVDADVAKSYEDLGNATGSYSGNLMTGELNNRRSELLSAIQSGAGVLDAGTMATLQKELGDVNAQLNNQHFYDNLTTQQGEFSSGLDEILANELLKSSQAA